MQTQRNIVESASAGACAWITPSFTDHGPQPRKYPGAPATAMQCPDATATSQLEAGDLSNSVALNGKGSHRENLLAQYSDSRGSPATRTLRDA